MANLEGLAHQYNSIERSRHSAHTAYQIASDRYKSGITFYLDVVESEQQELEIQRELNELLGLRYTATVQLIKALGGGW